MKANFEKYKCAVNTAWIEMCFWEYLEKWPISIQAFSDKVGPTCVILSGCIYTKQAGDLNLCSVAPALNNIVNQEVTGGSRLI